LIERLAVSDRTVSRRAPSTWSRSTPQRPTPARLSPRQPYVRGAPLDRLTRSGALALQRAAGNAAVTGLLERADRRGVLSVSRCGPDHPACGCSTDERIGGQDTAVQRDTNEAFDRFLRRRRAPFGSFGAEDEKLNFTNRSFMDESLPTECPRCHRDRPTIPMPARFVDREATEPRLVSWGQESERALHHAWTVRQLQLDPGAMDRIVDDYGVGLTKRITASHEFEGSEAVREEGASTVRRRWPDIRKPVYDKASGYYQDELMTALALTPKDASPVLAPNILRSVLTTTHGGTVFLGRWDATARPGQQVDNFVIYDTDGYTIWLYRQGRPAWIYVISATAYIRSHDPFVGDVARQVADKTRWIQHLMPFLLKVGAFGLGFSGSIALIIAGIVLDELATEMQADAEGRPGRSPEEILGSAGTQFLIDRLFHGLLGGGGKALAAAGKSAAKAERIAERAAPFVRRELIDAEKPLVQEALSAGTARKVTDDALKAEGYTIEVAITSGGQAHRYAMNKGGTWCRLSVRICDLDLGADVATAAKSPASMTAAKIETTREQMKQIEDEIVFLERIYQRMRPTGKVDVSLLSREERALLDDLADEGDAARLTLRELRDMSRAPQLKRHFEAAADEELRLVKQLYREGRPLHEIMRAASPSFASRSRVLREAAGRDAANGVHPRSGALAADHIVPLNDIVRMQGFENLRPERQLEIVNDVRNLRAIDSLANSSRRNQSWWTWPQAAIYYDAGAISRMRALEDDLRVYLAERIRTLSRL
jgi:hypothetical protein